MIERFLAAGPMRADEGGAWVYASDYDALASDLVAEKAIGTTAMYSAIERDVTIESMQADLDEAEARISELEAALAIVTQDRDTLLAMTGTTIEQVAARIRSAQETPVAHSKSQQKRIEAMTAPETK